MLRSMEQMDDGYRQAVTELMRGPVGGFAAARADMVRGLRQQGADELARRVAAVRKPALALWALNQTAAVAADDLDRLRAAGERLQQAQQSLLEGDRSAAEQMSEATQEHRRTIDLLSRRAGMVLTAAGHAASEDTMRRVREGLRLASFGGSETWSALRHGRLLSDPEPVSFPRLDVADMKRVAEEHDHQAKEARRRRLAAAQAEVRRAEDLEAAAREQEQAARARLQQAADAVRLARDALSKLRSTSEDESDQHLH